MSFSGDGTCEGFQKVKKLNKLPLVDDAISSLDEEEAKKLIESIESKKDTDTVSKAPVINVNAPQMGEIRDHVLNETAIVGEEYFSDTLFIGDSRMLGLSMTWKDCRATFYSAVGLSINQLNTKKVIKVSSDVSYTVMEAIETDGRDYKRVYLMFGLNELGWGYPSVFVRSVKDVIDQIRVLCPNAEFCIMGIMPIAADKSVSIYTGAVANARIREFNALLLGLASDIGGWYLDTYNLFANVEGNLPDGFAADGIHMYSEQNKKIIDFISTHAFAY